MTTSHSDLSFDPRPSLQRALLACLPGALALLWFNGWGLLVQLLLASASCCACEWLTRALRQQPSPRAEHSLFGLAPLAEGSGLVSAVLLALALPSYAPWWLTVSSAAFATLFGKSLFGGFGRNLFNPAMLGYAFALLAFPAQMVHWPAPGASHGLLAALQQIFGFGNSLIDGWSQATVLDSLKHNDGLTIDELFAQHPAFGGVGGRGVEWVNLAFLAGGLYLLQQKVIRWHAPLGMLGALFVISLLCWNGSGSDSNGSPLLHLFSGASMLGAFFIVTEPVSGAGSDRSRLYFGIGVGLLTYVIRTWGGYPDGLAFAVLLMNLCVPRLEQLASARNSGATP
ncbi:RnfABCDGE type electron transport complex subunit D [Aquipseudomonas ullengensis]|uniref:Ion-translocating oxidoreductase complex subunit D n=1 Tax=Aquipseudomonas ullengensis TaxID=2759166 RepID=A0A7W4LNR5_9GAMM|nr:RnfABCDGE type electron transport complex subunit D [Pseudomonas ullengensis]MBB2496554.1 RnfABCDGE type electron transport complex subunit D [Pseudomonas ullengensis]